MHEQPDAAARAHPRADLRLAVLVRRAHPRGEAVCVEGQPQVADVRDQQLGGELVEPLDRLAGRRHHAPRAVEQHDAGAAHQLGGAGRLGHHGVAQAGAMRAAARSSQVFSSSLKRALSRFSWARPQAASPYPNFVEEPADASAFFDPATWARLRTVKAAYDPANVFVGNHHIPPA